MIVGYNDSFDAEPQQTRWTITDPDKLTDVFKRDEFFTDFDDGGKAIKVSKHYRYKARANISSFYSSDW